MMRNKQTKLFVVSNEEGLYPVRILADLKEQRVFSPLDRCVRQGTVEKGHILAPT
jgi:hypothetical protein